MKNPFLRVKLKTLAEEAKIIRAEEARTYYYRCDENGVVTLVHHNVDRHNALALHRKGVVRREARATMIAYQYLRGVPFDTFERRPGKPTNRIDWSAVERMVKKYGGDIIALRRWASRDEHKRKVA